MTAVKIFRTPEGAPIRVLYGHASGVLVSAEDVMRALGRGFDLWCVVNIDSHHRPIVLFPAGIKPETAFDEVGFGAYLHLERGANASARKRLRAWALDEAKIFAPPSDGAVPLPLEVDCPTPVASLVTPVARATSAMVSVRPLQIGGESVQGVNARDLHAFLEVGKDFSTWIKVQIDRGRLRAARDYEEFATPPEGGAGNRGARIEYALSLDAAKHIAMLSGTDKGFEVREYFLECERQAKAAVSTVPSFRVPQTLAEALRLALELEEERSALACKIQQDAPKVEFAMAVRNSDNALALGKFAKVLGVGEVKFYRWLRESQILYKNGKANLPYQRFLDLGYFKVVENVIYMGSSLGNVPIPQTLVTGRGQIWLQRKWAAARGVA